MKYIAKILAVSAVMLCSQAYAASFVEGFEANKKTSYADGTVTGDACVWALTDAGVYGDNANSGTNSLRLGNTATSVAAMNANKSGGAGTVTFYAKKWDSDATATVLLEYSTNSGSSWTSAASLSLSATTYTKYTYNINKSGNVRIRFRQTAGKRVLFDDITISDYSGTTGGVTFTSPVNNSTVDFGTTASGTSVQQLITVKGTGLTSACSVAVSGTGFSVNTASLAASTVNSSNGGKVQVSFKSTAGGSYTGTLTLSSGGQTVKVNLKASVSGGSSSSAFTSPTNNSTVDFGSTAVNKSVVQSVNVKGTGVSGATNVAIKGTGFTANTTSLTASKVNSASGATVQVTFKPTTAGSKTGTLTLTNGATVITVNLKGSGTSSGGTTTSASYSSPAAGSTLDFNTVTANKTATNTIVVKGSGLTAATTVTVSGNGFSTGSTTLSAAKVNSATGAQLQINFKASATGTYSGTVKLTSGSLSRSVTLKASIGSSTGTGSQGTVTPSDPGSSNPDPGVSTGNEPAGYYSTAEGKCGTALLTALKNKVNPHTSVSYAKLWTSFKTTDTYPNGKIWDMYSSKQFTYSTDQCGNYTRVGDCYNREHSFPKSWFKEATPMYTDLFHVIPTDGFVNNQRGNNPFGVCANGTYVSPNGSVKARGKLGKSTYAGYTGTVWEPDDEFKGDFARSYFYMVTAYNDKVSGWSSPMLSGSGFSSWALSMLLQWNELDPVSQKELDRQEAVYAIQKNRNPFIDHPELAAHIWGAKKTTAWSASAAAASTTISKPTNGSTLNFGTVATGASNSKIIQVTGSNVTDNISVSVDGNGFEASAQWLDAGQVNGASSSGAPARAAAADDTDAAWLMITFTVAEPKNYEGTLTLRTGDTENKVYLKGVARDGLPAGEAEAVTDKSFEAVWVNVGDGIDGDKYRLDVSDDEGPLEGFPVYVIASDLYYRVENLEPGTKYYYSLTSESMQSNVVEVTTAEVVPEVVFTFLNGAMDLTASPNAPSASVELQIECIDMEGAVNLSVAAPFEISENRTDWSELIDIDAGLTDRFYLRLGAAPAGLYHSSVRVVYGEHYSDALMAHGTVSYPNTLFEDFEADHYGMNNYSEKTYTGTAARWELVDAGMWNASTSQYDYSRSGDYALRMGNTSASCLTMSEPVASLGSLEFHARKWNAKEADATVAVEYSTDEGASWQSIGTATVSELEFTPHYFCPMIGQPCMLRLRQTSGGRLFVDDLSVELPLSGVTAPVDEYSSWDAFSPTPGVICIEAPQGKDYAVYGIDGISYHSGVTDDTMELDVPSGALYIVTVGNTSRRVVVR